MTGRVTMLGISRWTGKGGSYRTIQRFCHSPKNWPTLMWVFFHSHCFNRDESYAIAGDEVVTTKSGKHTYGVDWFFSSLTNAPVKGLSFFVLSLVGLEKRESYPLRIEQIIKPSVESNVNSTLPPMVGKRKRGRPKGSKNKDKSQYTLSSELFRIKGMLSALLSMIGDTIALKYLLLDGKFGHHNAAQMALQMGLHLVSKLRHDSALYLPSQGGNTKCKYGLKISPRKLSDTFLQFRSMQGDWNLQCYQLRVLHKEFSVPINVVIILKTHQKTREQGHVILFSTDLTLNAKKLVELYSLRFQIEFNFRDAKQFWGLEDFMNVSQIAVTNMVNLAFFMVNFSQKILQRFRRDCVNDFSLLDLKAFYRGFRYVDELIKLLPQKPEPILMSRIVNRLGNIGAIHPISFG
ncbi:mobile element protein (plasmid) [Geminocystis sp. NIES-3709]|nr:mobile element protein [Geminocystis sp. NIES-3709]BAQ67017.1 mobile element protein [Geminocystis sp. NIES-3709]